MHLKKLIALTLAAAAITAPCAAEQAQTTSQQIANAKGTQAAAAKASATADTADTAKDTDEKLTPPPDVVTWVTPATAEAPCIVGTLAPNQVALGKIHIHDATTDVTHYWLAPTKVNGHGKWLTYTYGTTFGVRFHQGDYTYQDYGATEVATIAPNGIATPAGIEVGMPDTILQQKYGMPTHLTTAAQENGYTTTYYYYGYGSELGHELSFDVREGKIIKIRLRSYYEFPQHFYR